MLLGELREPRTRENGKHAGESKGELPDPGSPRVLAVERMEDFSDGTVGQCGVTGVNVSVPDLATCFPFAGWKDSFFGDLHATGREGVEFYTGRKVRISRWPGARVRRRGP